MASFLVCICQYCVHSYQIYTFSSKFWSFSLKLRMFGYVFVFVLKPSRPLRFHGGRHILSEDGGGEDGRMEDGDRPPCWYADCCKSSQSTMNLLVRACIFISIIILIIFFTLMQVLGQNKLYI